MARLKLFMVAQEEVTRKTYTVRAVSPEEAQFIVESGNENSEPSEQLVGTQTVVVRASRGGTDVNCGAALLVDAREHAHILAGLRLLQADPGDLRAWDRITLELVSNEGHPVMTNDELDDLAERLNA